MKNPVAILLLTLHLLAYTDVIQVFKFPNLFSHYQDHHLKNKSVGIIDFLLMHYGKCNEGNAKEDKDDMQLPFKTIEFHHIGHAIIAPKFTISFVTKDETQHCYYFNAYTSIITTSHKSSLLRPPILVA